jgi:2-haloacid dehalogenase
MQAYVFDAYGTLLDTVTAARRHAARIGPDWQAFSTLWRTKQFEYAWVRSLAGDAHHVDFSRVVDDALTFAAARHGIADPALLAELRESFEHLDAFADSRPNLERLRGAGARLVVLSNGTPAQLPGQLRAGGLDGLFEAVLSVEAAGVFKPDPRVYRLAVTQLGMEPGAIGFVSSNPWDAFGAHAFGFRVFWVNRTGQPEEYGLGRKATVLSDLSGLRAG